VNNHESKNSLLVFLAFVLGIVCAVGLVIALLAGLYFYVYRDQNVVHETQRAFETQSAAQAEKARAAEEIERARSVQIRAIDEVNQLKQEVEGIRRRNMNIPVLIVPTPETSAPVPVTPTNPAPIVPSSEPPHAAHQPPMVQPYVVYNVHHVVNNTAPPRMPPVPPPFIPVIRVETGGGYIHYQFDPTPTGNRYSYRHW
jgi:hypothetical protein